jgi:beta-glucanase (GH16 family)
MFQSSSSQEPPPIHLPRLRSPLEMAATWVACFLAGLLAVAAFILLRIILRVVGAFLVLWFILWVLVAAAHAAPVCKGQTFGDNFSNLSNWTIGGAGAVSSGNQLQSYQASEQNDATQITSDGLQMSVLPEASNGHDFIGSVISSQNSFSQTYGYFQATVDVSPGLLEQGMTGAFWLLGYTVPEGSNQSWPSEIDGYENFGGTFDSAMHSGFTTNNAAYYNYQFQPGEHTIGINWTHDTITWYVDGQQTNQVPTPPDFNTPMYPIFDTMATGDAASGASGSMTVKNVSAFSSMQAFTDCGGNVGASVKQTPPPTVPPYISPPYTPRTHEPPTPAETLQVGSTIQLQGTISPATGPLQSGMSMCNDPATLAANQKLCSDMLNADAQAQQAQSQIDPNQASTVQSDLSATPLNGTSTQAIDAQISAALQQLNAATQSAPQNGQ